MRIARFGRSEPIFRGLGDELFGSQGKEFLQHSLLIGREVGYSLFVNEPVRKASIACTSGTGRRRATVGGLIVQKLAGHGWKGIPEVTVFLRLNLQLRNCHSTRQQKARTSPKI